MNSIPLVLAALAAVAFGDILAGEGGGRDNNLLMVGTYEFEMMGRTHKLYICDTEKMEEDNKAMYWSITDTSTNEYTIGMCMF